MDIPYLLRRAALSFPTLRAVDDGERQVSLRGLVDRAERFANGLDQRGVEPGAAIGVLSGNRSEYPEVDCGIALGRRIRVALNARLKLPDFQFALRDAGAQALVYSRDFAGEAAALREELGLVTIGLDEDEPGDIGYGRLVDGAPATAVHRPGDDEDPVWISYTSGTTGFPKGVVLSHRAIREVTMNIILELGPIKRQEQLVLTQPLSHGAGYFTLPWLISGAGVYIMKRFDPGEVQAVCRRPEVRTLKIVPAMLRAMLDTPGRFDVETIVYGASPIPGPVLEAALDRYGPVLIQIYGQSEAPVTITCLGKVDHTGEQRHSAGRAWRSVAVDVRDPQGKQLGPGEQGEVTVRGNHMMSGYHNRPDETADVMREGRIWTKDVAVMDELGFIYLLGRGDEMINSGGFNIAPREVERAVLDHPAVEECVAIGVPDDQWGQAVHVVARLRAGDSASEFDIIQFVKPRLGFRSPKRVVVADRIPKNAYGKIDRTALMRSLLDARLS